VNRPSWSRGGGGHGEIIAGMRVKMVIAGVVQEVELTDAEAVELLNGRAVAYMADDVEPFVDVDGRVGERVRRSQVES
jgi:hypothetical protein